MDAYAADYIQYKGAYFSLVNVVLAQISTASFSFASELIYDQFSFTNGSYNITSGSAISVKKFMLSRTGSILTSPCVIV